MPVSQPQPGRPLRPTAATPGTPPGSISGSLRITAERERATAGWQTAARADRDFANLAKSLPALLAASGLMATLAFLAGKAKKKKRSLQEDGDGVHGAMLGVLLGWLAQRRVAAPTKYEEMQDWLLARKPGEYRLLTEEALGLLAWVRHFADARATEE